MRSGREHTEHGATTNGGTVDVLKEDRRFNRTLERATTNFWIVMGESGGKAGEPTEPRGVGGINVITGAISFGMFTLDSADQLTARFRALVNWKPHYPASSTEMCDCLRHVSNLFVVPVFFARSGVCASARSDDSLTSIRP
jgi:hypothetical protein